MAFTNAKDDCLVKLCNNKNPEAETSKTAVERSVWEEKAKKWRRTSATGFCKEETSFGGARFFVPNEVATAIEVEKENKQRRFRDIRSVALMLLHKTCPSPSYNYAYLRMVEI
ncbi:hypothetical protein F8388_007791 [Cannabis sativa]|uniref:Uncharacterized protein n=1 Tax=Cannabis sativa TaxID=3483 RepID=A0A7J6FT80_CANSA|nr:hypothetical protein F8388_007791 [Cannabis sativa]